MTPRVTRWLSAALMATTLLPAVAWSQSVPPVAGSGLAAPADTSPWPQLQWRVMPTVQATGLVPPSAETGGGLLGTALVADWYLSSSKLGPTVVGGFRATSGLVARSVEGGLRPRTAADAGPTMPYLGLGYSGLHTPTGWGVAADLGLVATTPGAVRLGRSTVTGAAVDDLVRDLRLAPIVRLNISYAF